MDSKEPYSFTNQSELNLANDSLNDNLIATLNRKNLNSLNARFAGLNFDNSFDSELDLKQQLASNPLAYSGDAMYKQSRPNGGGGGTEILLHQQQQQHSSPSKMSANKSGGNTAVKHSTLPKTGQLGQLNQLNLNTPLIDENVQCSILIKWLCSPPLLCVVLLAYACFGALLFHHLEAGAEVLSVSNVAALRNNTLQRLWNITFTFNLLYPRNWTANATNELIQFERAVIYMVSGPPIFSLVLFGLFGLFRDSRRRSSGGTPLKALHWRSIGGAPLKSSSAGIKNSSLN